MRAFRGLLLISVILGNAYGLPTLMRIEFAKEHGDSVWVVRLYTGTIPEYRSFFLEPGAPVMFVVDLMNTKNSLHPKDYDVTDAPPVLRVRTSQYQIEPIPISRVVIDLAKKVPIQVETQRDHLEIRVQIQGIKKAVVEVTPIPASPQPPTEKVPASVYRPLGKKDPFAEPKLLPEEKDLLDVHGAELTGILQLSNGDRIALIRDQSGRGWVLHEGDRVKYGRLTKIGKNFVIFYIRDMGVLKRIRLELQTEEKGR